MSTVHIDGNDAYCVTGDFSPSTKETTAFTNPVVAGVGALVGPLRQRIVQSQSLHGVPGLLSGKELQADLAAIVGDFITLNADGQTEIGSVYVKSCIPHRPKGAAGLPAPATHLVVADWEFILPIDW